MHALLVFALLGGVSSTKGVAPENKPLYQIGNAFKCIDGSKSVAIEHVNDDYCDCPDGSDEPGTGEAQIPHVLSISHMKTPKLLAAGGLFIARIQLMLAKRFILQMSTMGFVTAVTAVTSTTAPVCAATRVLRKLRRQL